MDEQFRKLERQYFTDQLSPQESYRLRKIYTTYFGHCPSNYVIKEITDSVNSYSRWLHEHHITVNENLSNALGHLCHIPEIDQLLVVQQPYRLEISLSIEEHNLFPMIVAQAQIHHQPDERPEIWIEKVLAAADHIRNIFAATFSQCGYTECAEIISPVPRTRISIDGCRVVGIGSPRSAFLNDGDLVTLPGLGALYRQMFGDDLMSIRAAVPLNAFDLTWPNSLPGADLAEQMPGQGRLSLRNWLLLRGLDGGHLVLAGVTARIFRNHSSDIARARRQLGDASEADIVDPPEMVYFVPKHSTDIWVIPTSDNYFKDCDFLRLLAGI